MSAQHVIIAPEHSCSIWTCAGHARRSFDNLSRRRRRYSSTRFLSDHRLLRRPSGTLRSGGCDTQRGVRLHSISKASSKEATCASTSSESHIAVPHRWHGAPDHRIAARSARPMPGLDIHGRQSHRPRTTAVSMPTNCAAMKAGAGWEIAISTLSTSRFLARNALLHDRASFIPAARVVHDLYY